MRNTVLFPALGIALLAGTTLAQAQPVETVITPAPGPLVIAQQPVVVTEPAPVVETVPVQTTETVRTERSTTRPPRRRVARARIHAPLYAPLRAPRRGPTETTTRTTISESIAPAPVGPAVAPIAPAPYTDVVAAPPAYGAPLYDVVPGGPPAAFVAPPPMPAYQYVYQPDRVLVIDANTGVAVQAIPR